jgi:MFS family permease
MDAETTPERRATLVLLAVATAIGALGLAAGGSAGALLAEDMTGSTTWAGVPLGFLVLGSAAGALLISRQTSRAGRGRGLVLGYGVGVAGAAMVVAATEVDDFALLLAGSAALGAANAAIFLTRYAAADLGGESGRGRALGIVFFATALGAVVSPNLLGPSGDVAEELGLVSLSDLYLVAVAFGLAGALVAALPRRALPVTSGGLSGGELRTGLRGARLPLLVLGASNFVMVAVMAIAPVHLVAHGHSLNFVVARLDGDFQHSDSRERDPHAWVVFDDLHERVVAVPAADDDSGAPKHVSRANRPGCAAVVAGADRGRHLDGENFLQQSRDRVAIEHQCIHLSLLWVRSARS